MEHSVVNAGETQRERTRDSLFMGAKITIGNSLAAVSTVIRNLSPGGVMIDCPTGLKKDQRVTTHLRNVGEVGGTVCWVHNGRAGVMFDEQIDPEDVRRTVGKPKPEGVQAAVAGVFSVQLAKGVVLDVLVPGIGSIKGTVDWVEEKRMGISFDRSLFHR